MRILQKPITAKKGQQIEVTFNRPTNVKLLSASEFRKYKRGKTHKYFGGWQETSPVMFTVPEDGVWHAVIEKGSFQNPIDVSGNANLMNAAPAIKAKPAVAAIPLDTDISVEHVDTESTENGHSEENH
jgi:hypothetical protein